VTSRSAAPFVAALSALTACSSGVIDGVAPSPAQPVARGAVSVRSVSAAYDFLRLMMDKYAKGSTRRLVQSFDGGPLEKFTDAITYDDALVVDAMLTSATRGDVARAKVIGNALIYVQANDPAGDGRLRASYAPKPLRAPRDVVIRDRSTDAGNMAWAGLALVRLYAVTSDRSYLDGAVAVAQWLQTNTYDTRGSGGYTGGYTARDAKIEWKSTEHNVDLYAFFTMLATESGDGQWSESAAWAEQFVASMWDARQGRFYVGTGNDGTTPNRSFKPEDVNSWSYLAFENPAWAVAPTWDVEHLKVNRGGFAGVSFCSADRSGVWFEGTAHLADALELRGASGDASRAQAYLGDIEYAQANGPNGDGRGIIAASKALSDCDGSKYYPSLHVGATAWYVLAAAGSNPFVLLRRSRRQ